MNNSEALNHFSKLLGNQSPTISEKINVVIEATSTAEVFGEENKSYYGTISASGIGTGTVISFDESRLQLVADEDGNILEKRISFETMDAFYSEGLVTFAGFSADK